MSSSNISLYKNILTEFGLDKLSPEDQEIALKQLGDVIFQKVSLKVVELLPPTDLDEFNKILQVPEESEAALEFLKTKIPNFATVVNEIIAEFKEEMSELAQVAKTQAQI